MWFHAIQLLVIILTIELLQWSWPYDVMLFSNHGHQDCHWWLIQWSHHMMSCYSVTGHQDCHWSHSMVNDMMSCYDSNWHDIKIVIELIQWSILWCHADSVIGHKIDHWSHSMVNMMSCYSVTGHQDDHWTHSMVIYDVMLSVTGHQGWPLNSFNGQSWWCHITSVAGHHK